MKVCLRCEHNNPDENTFCEQCGEQLPGEEGKDPLIGKLISGKFEVVELIGQGAMGKVYRAIQKPIEREVAIKLLHPHLMEDKRVTKRFMREAQAASRFNHPNSIQIFDFGQTEDGSLYIAMEYITGTDLAEVIAKEAPLDPQRVVHIATQALSALQIAHLNKIIHRDLKPENIMLEELPDNKEFVKVCDFGIAKIQQPVHGNRESALTVFGMICGTPYYMSPEQARGEELDGRTDLYSMGVILYEMLTGEIPFHGATPVEVIAKHLTEKPKPLREVRPDLNIPPKLEQVVMKALEKDRNRRFSSAQEMADALKQAIAEESLAKDLQSLVREVEDSPPIVVGKPIEEDKKSPSYQITDQSTPSINSKPPVSSPPIVQESPALQTPVESKSIPVATSRSKEVATAAATRQRELSGEIKVTTSSSPTARSSSMSENSSSNLLLKEVKHPERTRKQTPQNSLPQFDEAVSSSKEFLRDFPEEYPDSKSNKPLKPIFIAAVLSAVAIIGGGIWLFFIKGDNNTNGKRLTSADPLPKLTEETQREKSLLARNKSQKKKREVSVVPETPREGKVEESSNQERETKKNLALPKKETSSQENNTSKRRDYHPLKKPKKGPKKKRPAVKLTTHRKTIDKPQKLSPQEQARRYRKL